MAAIVTGSDTGGASGHAPAWLRPAVVDRIEQVAIVLLWIWFVWRIELSNNPYAPLLLISETAIVLFTVFRRPTERLTMRLGDWLLAMTATAAPLMILPGVVLVPALVPVGIALYVAGNVMQIWAKLILRRSFGVAPANRGIKIAGPYRIVRHPMYMGYALIHISMLMLMFWPVNVVIYIIGWWAQILRLKAEERVLGQDPEYAEYMQNVRWRLVPGVF